MTTYDSNLQIITVLLINNKLKFEILCNSNYLRYLLQNPVIQVGATSITAILLSIIQIATYKHPNSPLTADTNLVFSEPDLPVSPCLSACLSGCSRASDASRFLGAMSKLLSLCAK